MLKYINICKCCGPQKHAHTHTQLYIYMYIYISCYTDGMNVLYFHLPFISIIHYAWKVSLTALSVHTELMNLSLCWSAKSSVSMSGSPPENFIYEFVLFSGSAQQSYSSLWDGRWVATQQLFCGMLLPGFDENNSQPFCIVPIWFFLQVLL